MPREVVTVQVGQCGNQIGSAFWAAALREHAAANPDGLYDDAMSSFFQNVDTRFQPPINMPVGNGLGPIKTLKARAVVVDMEEGVVNALLKGPLGCLLDQRQLLYDVSGAGNNWAHGHHGYGPHYRQQLAGALRHAAEASDSLQGFLLLHSLGGGTGSGLGTYLLEMMQDEYPGTLRFSVPVLPSADDDVVTSPYNAVLAAAALARAASAALPLDNAALAAAAARIEAAAAAGHTRSAHTAPVAAAAAAVSGDGSAAAARSGAARAWGTMNGLAASLLLHLTSSVRFEGSLNTDLSDITVNLVPFPRMHLLLPGMAPLALPRDVAALSLPRSMNQLFEDAFSSEAQLVCANPAAHTYLAAALLGRGALSLSAAQRALARLRPGLRMPYWSQESFKLGLCSRPPLGVPASLLVLSNNCATGGVLQDMLRRFQKLHSRRLFHHHYAQYMEVAAFDEAANILADVADAYSAADTAAMAPPADLDRLLPRGTHFVA